MHGLTVSVLKFKCVCNEVFIRPHEYKVAFPKALAWLT